MATAPARPVDDFTFTPFQVDAILVSTKHVDAVEAALRTLGNAVPTFARQTENLLSQAITPFIPAQRCTRDEISSVIDKIRETCREKLFSGFEPAISPKHEVVTGQPNTDGNPYGNPDPTNERFPNRVGSAEGRPITIGVIDTGIERHQWLDGAYLAGPDELAPRRTVKVKGRQALGLQAGHGLFLSGLIIRQAPAATVKVWKVLDSNGKADIETVAAAIERAADSGLDILNLSLGCFTRYNRPTWTLADAIDRLDSSTVVVASAGNSTEKENRNRPFWPGALANVIAVGAVEQTNAGWQIAKYSIRGPWVDVYVPASNVLSTFLEHDGVQALEDRNGTLTVSKAPKKFKGWAKWTGSSMAAAIVSGTIGRIAFEEDISAKQAAAWLLRQPETLPFPVERISLVDDRRSDFEPLALRFDPPAGDPIPFTRARGRPSGRSDSTGRSRGRRST